MPARNTLVQLLAAYTNPESHNAQRYRQRDRQMDGQQDYANSRSYCLAVRSAKNIYVLKLLMKWTIKQLQAKNSEHLYDAICCFIWP